MTRWEYKFIECFSYLEDWYPAYENGEEITNWKAGGNIAAFSNRLGSEGWEMIAVTDAAAGSSSSYREIFRVVFKRPLESVGPG